MSSCRVVGGVGTVVAGFGVWLLYHIEAHWMSTLKPVDPILFCCIQLAPLSFLQDGDAGNLEVVIDASVMVVHGENPVGVSRSVSRDPMFEGSHSLSHVVCARAFPAL